MPIKLQKHLHVSIAALGIAMMMSAAAAQDGGLPRLHTNEVYVAEVTTRNQTLACSDARPTGSRSIRPKTIITFRSFCELIEAVEGNRHSEKMFRAFGPFPEGLPDTAVL
jgi:hypothetical protein